LIGETRHVDFDAYAWVLTDPVQIEGWGG